MSEYKSQDLGLFMRSVKRLNIQAGIFAGL